MDDITFEAALNELEKIVNEMEEGNLSLDDSLTKFELGIKMARLCSNKLEQAEKKVEMLLASENGEVELRPFEMPEAQDE